MPKEVDFEWTDYKGNPIGTERPRSSTEASDEFLRKVSRTFNVVGVMASAETLWIIREALSKQDPVLLIVGITSGINTAAAFGYARNIRARQQIEKEIEF